MGRQSYLWAIVFVLHGSLAAPLAAGGELLLPDFIVRRSDLFDNSVTDSVAPGRIHLRLSNATANIGEGKFEIHSVGEGADEAGQLLRQRVFRDDGSFVDVDAGRFVFHPEHHHIHVEAWAVYRLRQMLPEKGVGKVLAEGTKTSYCILDLQVYDSSIPGFAEKPEFRSCASAVQGLSVGWADIYDKSLPDQHIDISGIPPGRYWLESEVDPDDHFLEMDEENNVARVEITIGDTGAFLPDAYEPNDHIDEVDARPAGGFTSPNLGPAGPARVVRGLSIHERNNVDLFKFYSNDIGADGDFIRIDFDDSRGNLDLALLTGDGELAAESRTERRWEYISLKGAPKGWLYVKIEGRDGDVNSHYTLTIDPPANAPPNVDILAPDRGDTELLHGLEMYTARWRASDIERDLTWVSVYLNTAPRLDGEEQLLPSSRYTPGEMGFHIINSAEVEPGTYWVYCEITDGGVTAGAWSRGTISFLEIPPSCTTISGDDHDCDENGLVDACDIDLGLAPDCDGNGFPDGCDISSERLADADVDGIPDTCRTPFHRGDADDDGFLSVSDAAILLAFLFRGGNEPGCLEAADVNNDSTIDLSDPVVIFSFLFRGGPPPPGRGSTGEVCAVDQDPPGSSGDLGCGSYDHCFDAAG